MNILSKVFSSCVVIKLCRTRLLLNYRVSPSISTVCNLKLAPNNSEIITTSMSQRSITSFFTKTPKKSIETDDDSGSPSSNKNTSPPAKKPVVEKESPISNGKTEKRSSKRQHLESSGSESKPSKKATPELSPIKSDKKKKVKRQRIESSDSDTSTLPTEACNEEQSTTKTEKPETPHKTSNPKKAKVKQEKTPLVEQNGKEDNKKKGRSKTPPKKKEKLEVKKEVAVQKVKEEGNQEVEHVPEEEYNPSKSKYHPIKDACWSRGQEVPYLALAKTLEAIEATSARLKIVDILSNYFRSVIVLTPEDLLPSVYMCLNQLGPAYHSMELGIAETYLMKAIGQCTGRTLGQVKSAAQKTGDLGLVAEQARATQRTMFASAPLRARRVYAALKEVAAFTGQASVNKKIAKIQSLYVACRQSEARYLIRSLAGKLRIGLAEQSVLQALAQATAMTPPAQTETLDASKGLSAEQFKAKVDANSLIIKTTYCECPNYDLVIPVMLQHGVAALPQHCKLTPGIPLKPMLAHPTKGVSEVFNRFEGLSFTCEWKYDGERAQIHVPPGESGPALDQAAIFSRNQENNTTKYPDILGRLGALLKEGVRDCVLDCEAVAFDVENKQILPFQILSTRKRKDATESEIKVQVCVYVFDLLYLNGEALVKEPLQTRRELLKKNFNEVEGVWQFATSRDCSTMEEVQQFLDESVKGSCEGLMVKTLSGKDATYEIAKRSHNWLKLKKDYLDGVGDTLDVVVIGGYCGRGKRTGVFGGFLLACYDPETEEYQSLCKIGTGFSDADLKSLSETLQEHVIEAPRGYYRYDTSHTPDTWFAPACVWEVRCADLSLSPAHRAALSLLHQDKGVSLRFPRFVRVRDDKTPEEATSAQQVADLYLSQDQVKNQANKSVTNDDFY